VLEEGKTTCCYAKSEKSWIDDPAGIAWETLLTTGEATTYGSARPQSVDTDAAIRCCEPTGPAEVAESARAACCSG
jgi:hypothetical protein